MKKIKGKTYFHAKGCGMEIDNIIVKSIMEDSAKTFFEELRNKGRIKKIPIDSTPNRQWATMFQLSISPKQLKDWEKEWDIEWGVK